MPQVRLVSKKLWTKKQAAIKEENIKSIHVCCEQYHSYFFSSPSAALFVWNWLTRKRNYVFPYNFLCFISILYEAHSLQYPPLYCILSNEKELICCELTRNTHSKYCKVCIPQLYLNNNLQAVNFYKIIKIWRWRTHHTQVYLRGKHRIRPRPGSKFSVQSLIPRYVLPLSFNIPASCSRYTGYGIGRASCCIDLTSPFSPNELTVGSLLLHTLPTMQTGQVAPAGPKLLPSRAQSWPDHSEIKQQNRLLSRLVWIFLYTEIPSTARETLCNRLLSLGMALSGRKDHNKSQASSSEWCLVKNNITRTLLGPWSAVTTFQYKCWQWQSCINSIPNTEKEKNWPKSLTFYYISLLPHTEHWCWHYPYQITIKKQPHTSGPLPAHVCVLACCEHSRVDGSWQSRTVHKQNKGLIIKQQIKALPSVHYPLGKSNMAIYGHSILVM